LRSVVSLAHSDIAPVAPRTRGLPLVDHLARHGERPALIHRGTVTTYGDLARQVADRARELGDGRRVVMVAGANEPEMVVSHLAALAGGHVSWLVPSVAGAAGQREVFGPDTLVSADGDGVAIEAVDAEPAREVHPDLAMLMGTSGSTGAPRLVRLSHANLQSNAEAIAAYLSLGPGDRAITSLPMHYCYGLSVIHSHLWVGAAIVLTERSVTDPAFWGLVRTHRVTGFAGVPHTFDLLERAGFADMHVPSLRYITQAGGRLAPERVRRHAELGARRGWELVVMYGQTEATARMAYLPAALAAAHPHCVGVPIPGGAFEIRPGGDHPDPEVGELIYRGPNVMMGYAQGPADLARGAGLDELATGDLARRTPEGLYEIVGRRSRFLKIFGLRVDLAQVEGILTEEGIEAVCAGEDERLAIAVTGGACPAATTCLVAGRLGIPAWRITARHHAEIPRLPNGKPDYRAITAGAPAQAAPARGRRPWPAGRRRPTSVAALFAAALGREEVGPDDSFASLGGDSLTYVEVSVGLEEILGRVPAGWEGMPVSALDASARGERGAGAWTRMETGVALRAGAILLVLASHMTDVVPAGGAHLLLALAGYMFARFTLAAIDAPRRLGRALASVARIAVPASVWIALVMLTLGGYSLGTMLLVNNYSGDPSFSDGRWHYWFIEALVQILLVAALLFTVPAVRRWERARPFAFALALLAAALVFRFDLVALGDPTREIFRPHTVAWLFILGWLAYRAGTPARRLAASALVVACVPGFFGDPAREAIIAAGLLILMWLPAVPVPRVAVRAVGLTAGASLYIYLTHWQVWPALPGALPVPVLMVACVLAGIAVWWASERLTAAVATSGRRLAACRVVTRAARVRRLRTYRDAAID
jgi:acyl-CoA synthetase (AMP-forming)/AMP-acid ligase II